MSSSGTPRAAARCGLALALLLAVPGGGPLQAQSAPAPTYDGLTRQLRQLADGSELARISSIATTAEGRDVWMVEVADRDGAPVEERPALLVVANLSADHVVGSRLAVGAVERILARADEPEVAELLGRHVIYVVPRANPDGAEDVLTGVRWERRGNARPHDDDNDGRIDEDGPDDLNGDGMITVMRVVDPEGDYVVHPDDARLMKRADATAGEAGRYSIHWEGVDDDGDGFVNEDGPGGVDLDRNFQHEYPYWQADAGPHMVSEAESRALVDFAVAHRNIAAILTWGHSDNLVTPPNGQGRLGPASLGDLMGFADAADDEALEVGVYSTTPDNAFGGLRLRGAQPGRDNNPQSGRRPATTVNGDDVPYFAAVAERYGEVTGIDATPLNRVPEGAFFQFGYFQYGVPSFTTQGWAMPTGEGEGPGRGATLEQEALHRLGDAAFVAWSPVDHPDFDEVEVGGFVPQALTNPASPDAAAIEAQGDFVVALAGMLPRVAIADTEVTAHGGGIYTVSAVVENAGYFPTALAHGITAGAVDPVLVQIQVDPDAIVTGAEKSARIRTLAGSGNRERISWVIRGRSGQQVEIRVRAQKGGTDTATVRLGGDR